MVLTKVAACITAMNLQEALKTNLFVLTHISHEGR